MEGDDHEDALKSFCYRVWLYCFRFRGSVSSWIRTPHRNVLVGGVRDSFHVRGLAADVVLDDPSIAPVMTDDRHRFARELGLKLIIEADHDHLQLS